MHQGKLDLGEPDLAAPEFHLGDARNLAQFVRKTVDICVTSPPYWDVLEQKRTADYKQIRRYGEAESDVGRIADYEHFLSELDKVWDGVHHVLKARGYMIVVVMDLRKADKFYPLHMDVVRHVTQVGTHPPVS